MTSGMALGHPLSAIRSRPIAAPPAQGWSSAARRPEPGAAARYQRYSFSYIPRFLVRIRT
jgi:hypothetical protein